MAVNLRTLTTARGRRIGFIRFVERWSERNQEIGIVVLERFIDLPGAYLNQYVFALLDLAAARLLVYSEVDGQSMVIRTSRFPSTMPDGGTVSYQSQPLPYTVTARFDPPCSDAISGQDTFPSRAWQAHTSSESTVSMRAKSAIFSRTS